MLLVYRQPASSFKLDLRHRVELFLRDAKFIHEFLMCLELARIAIPARKALLGQRKVGGILPRLTKALVFAILVGRDDHGRRHTPLHELLVLLARREHTNAPRLAEACQRGSPFVRRGRRRPA